MAHRLVLVILLFAWLVVRPSVSSSFGQALEDTPPSSEAPPAPIPPDEHRLPELLTHEREDAVTALGTLRNAVRLSPDSADDRLKLAEGLYRIGDLDAAIDECRVAITLNPNNA